MLYQHNNKIVVTIVSVPFCSGLLNGIKTARDRSERVHATFDVVKSLDDSVHSAFVQIFFSDEFMIRCRNSPSICRFFKCSTVTALIAPDLLRSKAS